MSYTDEAGQTHNAVRKVNYTHDAMIDLIIANPSINQGEIAAAFGYTETWISLVFSSDAFKHRLAQRRAELVDPAIVASIEERFEALVRQSQERVLEKLANPNVSDKFALSALEASGRALGYGLRAAPTVAAQANVVVHVPAPVASAADWQRTYTPQTRQPETVDAFQESSPATPDGSCSQ